MKKISSILTLLLLATLLWPAAAVAGKTPGCAPGTFPIQTAADDDDDDDDPPYVEPAFTVYFDIDAPESVYITVNEQPIAHHDGVNTVTVDPGDGYIKVHVVDGYAFTRFYDETQGCDFLQYDYQTMPVTIRKAIGIGEAEALLTDGDTFTVRTVDLAAFSQYSVNVNVDHADRAEVVVGPSVDIMSSNNRRVVLQDGANTVPYSSIDKYVHLTGVSLTQPLQSVTCNGSNVPNDGTLNPVYSVLLKGESTQGAVIDVVTAPDQVEDPFSFTAFFDDPESIKYVSKMPADINLPFSQGDNTYTFKVGDYFEIWTYGPALSCTIDGDEIDFDATYRRYKFYPYNGARLEMLFHEPGPEPLTFTLDIDDASMVDQFYNADSDIDIPLSDGLNTVEIAQEGDGFVLVPVNKTRAYSFTLDGAEVAMYRSRQYNFTPEPGSVVVVRFHEPVIPDDPEISINVDHADRVVVYTGNYAAASTIITLADGQNTFTVDSSVEKINIAPAPCVFIDSVTDGDGNACQPDDEGIFTFPVANGLSLTVATSPVDFSEAFAIIVEAPEGVEPDGEFITGADRGIAVTEHYNLVPFNSLYDQYVLFAYAPQPTAVYVNGEELTESPDLPGIYGFVPAHADIVRIYFTPQKPEAHSVAFHIAESVEGAFTVQRDLMQDVDTSASLSELHGTYYAIIPAEGVRLLVTVASEYDEQTRRAVARDAVNVPLTDGAHIFRVEQPVHIVIAEDSPAAIGAIGNEGAPQPVYNMQGIRVADSTDGLPAGIYITGGRKIVVR